MTPRSGPARRGSVRLGGGGAIIHKPHWASRCCGHSEAKDVPFERVAVPEIEQNDVGLRMEPYSFINPIPQKIEPERLQRVFAFAVSAWSEAASRKKEEEEEVVDPEQRAMNLASKFAKRWQLRAVASAATNALVEKAEGEKDNEEEEKDISTKVQIAPKVHTAPCLTSLLLPDNFGAKNEGRPSSAGKDRYVTDDGKEQVHQGGRSYISSGGWSEGSVKSCTYASAWKAFGISSVGEEDDSDDRGASSCASPSPRRLKNDQEDRSQRHKRLTRPVDAEEFHQAGPPVALKLSDFPPINNRKNLDQRPQGMTSHYDYFDSKCTKFPDGLLNSSLRRARQQRVMNLALTVVSPSRQNTHNLESQDMRVESVSPPSSPKLRKPDGSILPRLCTKTTMRP